MSRTAAPPREAEAPLGRLWRRTGVRLAVIQVGVLLIAFGVAGMLARSDIRASSEAAMRREILGEAGSLQDEIVRFGEAKLASTVERRTRLWRGFEYCLQRPAGGAISGRLPAPPRRQGWTRLSAPALHGGEQAFFVYTERTPAGDWLSVGKDLAASRREVRLITWRLVAAAAWGGLACLAVWALSVRSTWRRLADIADGARLVADGRLNVRVPAGRAPRRDDIDELGAALNAMLDRVAGLVDRLRRVTTDVAHDLRTPLTRVRQKLEQLEAAPDLPPDRRAVVTAAQAELEALLRTFDALLQLAEIEGRSLADEGRSFDLAEVAERVAHAFRPDVEASGRRLEIATVPAPVAGDAALVFQMLANLIENGMRYTPAGSTLRIAVEVNDRAARLSVVDDGPGVPEHLREAVLAPYFRLDPSRGSRGAGIGLAIVAAVAARHGAALWLEDNRPGLRVVVLFPPPGPPAQAAFSGPTAAAAE